MKQIFLIIKGFIIGLANIIPGVSGGTMAVILGIYEKILDAANNLLKSFKKSFLYLLPILVGVILSILLGSKAINFALKNVPYIIILFFVGLIIGGIPMMYNKIKDEKKPLNLIILFIGLAIVILIAILNPKKPILNNLNTFNYIMLFIMGVIASASMIIPGISGSMMMMLLGYYDLIINTVANITDFSLFKENMLILLPFGIGVLFGLLLAIKLISYLLKKFEIKTYFAIIGFIVGSIFVIVYKLSDYEFNLIHLIIGIIMIPIGTIAGLYLTRIGKKDELNTVNEEKVA